MDVKFCDKCECEKPIGDFRVVRYGKDGLPRFRAHCKSCEWKLRSDEARERKRERERGKLAKIDGLRERSRTARLKYQAKKRIEKYGETQLDCVVPMSAGGPFMYYNVKTCCHRCNSAKSDSIYNEQIIKHAKGATQYRLAI